MVRRKAAPLRDEWWVPAGRPRARRGDDAPARGAIIDFGERDELPGPERPLRERLQLQKGAADALRLEQSQAAHVAAGAIVEDWLDGRRVYQEPPRRRHQVDPIPRLRDRIDVWILCLAALAVLEGCALVAAGPGPSGWLSPAGVAFVLRVGCACALALLPSAVLVWRRDAWRSGPLVFAGAILWTVPPAVATLGWWLAPALFRGLGSGWSGLTAGITVVACLGPAVMGFGLERVRPSRAPWLWPLAWRFGSIVAIWSLVSIGQSFLSSNGPSQEPLGAGFDALRLPLTVGGVAGPMGRGGVPLELLGLAILAGSALSAVVAQDPQRRLWQALGAGATLLAAVRLVELPGGDGTGLGAGALGAGGLAPAGSASAGPELMLAWGAFAAGSCLLLLAFASPVWSAAADADGPASGAPDEIFAWGAMADVERARPIAMQQVMAVAAGADHGLALDSTGHVGAWGDNARGQCNVPAGLADMIAVAAGDGFSLALHAGGTVTAWGANDRGQIAVPPGLAGVTAIAAGRAFGLALRFDGSVVGWGDARGAVPVPSELSDVSAIAAGSAHALALRSDGTVVAWGDDSCGQVSGRRGLAQVKAISAGGDFSLALLADGSVAAWGDNTYGQIDVPAGLRNVTAISAGAFHSVALLAAGDVVGWGGGETAGAPGEASHPWRLVDFQAVSAGEGFSLALRARASRAYRQS